MSKRPNLLAKSLRITAAAALVTAALYPAAEAQAVEQIQRYCQASWRNARIQEQDWDDCTQQAMERLLERVSRHGLTTAIQRPQSTERRELNRAIWSTVQRVRRSRRLTSLDGFDVADESSDQAASGPDVGGDDNEQLALVDAALQKLSPTQRKVLTRWSQGAPVRDIAAELDISAARVSDHKYKAIQKLRRMLSA